jgi:hypothetical protein
LPPDQYAAECSPDPISPQPGPTACEKLYGMVCCREPEASQQAEDELCYDEGDMDDPTPAPDPENKCTEEGLSKGSYIDEKGFIVGSPCDPVEYCKDKSSTNPTVVDYCEDIWTDIDDCLNGQGQERYPGCSSKSPTTPLPTPPDKVISPIEPITPDPLDENVLPDPGGVPPTDGPTDVDDGNVKSEEPEPEEETNEPEVEPQEKASDSGEEEE